MSIHARKELLESQVDELRTRNQNTAKANKRLEEQLK